MQKVVAVIDDELEMEDLYEIILEKQIRRGLINLKFFSDSRDFLSWFKDNQPDLILSDINMPHLGGPEVMKLVRKSGSGIPTYFVSGYAESEYTRIMKELGVYRFISKPLNFSHVQSLIEFDLGILAANL
ncbi:response regulator transcription factor [Peredibacter sp. HCB2-198]|uniref:response regulator transcription factor n=1 Tax=Peredibacter sp. HCB2-198 TaxID=3383025 RepID=UPI0038B41E6F